MNNAIKISRFLTFSLEKKTFDSKVLVYRILWFDIVQLIGRDSSQFLSSSSWYGLGGVRYDHRCFLHG